MNSMWFNVEHYHNTHSTQYRCTHYTLFSTARCFQSVCSSVTPWCVILFSTNTSPLVHPTVHIPPEPHQSRHPPQGLSRKMRIVQYLLLCLLPLKNVREWWCSAKRVSLASRNYICMTFPYGHHFTVYTFISRNYRLRDCTSQHDTELRAHLSQNRRSDLKSCL
jgi:hypothetical protein